MLGTSQSVQACDQAELDGKSVFTSVAAAMSKVVAVAR
jgi:hypothetical protein